MAGNVIVDGIGIFEKTFSAFKESFVIIGGAELVPSFRGAPESTLPNVRAH